MNNLKMLEDAIYHLKELLSKNDFPCIECRAEHERLYHWLIELYNYKMEDTWRI